MNNYYDIIITGAGCAGLSLVHHLLQSPSLQIKRVLLLDYASKDQNDRTWCFWTKQIPNYHSAQQHSWQSLLFRGESTEKTQDINPYKYVHVRGEHFYQEVLHSIEQNPNVLFKREKVSKILSTESNVVVSTSKDTYISDYVFNSIPALNIQSYSGKISTKQHFLGYFIETKEDVFDESQAILMDFQVTQQEQTRFFYVLPFSKNKALVEFTVFSDKLLHQDEYKQVLNNYLSQNLALGDYHITEEERGAIPMSNALVEVNPQERIFHLGTAGGMTKATTGYTFRNIQLACRNLIMNWEKDGKPQFTLKKPRRFRFYDTLLLYIIKYHGIRVATIMECLFVRNKFQMVLKFLDEETSLWEELKLFLKLPFKPFLKAIYHVYLQPKTNPKKRKNWRRKLVGNTSNI